MKRFLVIQCIRDEEVCKKLVKDTFGTNEIKVVNYLCDIMRCLNKQEIKITDDFRYYFYEPTLKNLEELKNFAGELELLYVVKMFDFLVDPTYDRYKELLCISDVEERDIVRRYLERLYFGYEEKSEDEFNLCIVDRARNLQLFKQKNIKELLVKNECYGLEYSATCTYNVFDDLMEKQSFVEEIQDLGDVFLRSYAFVAAVQIESWDDNKTAGKTTINRLIQLLKEINQRKLYASRLFTIVIFVLNSKYHAELQRTVQNLDFVENMSDGQIMNEILYRRPWSRPDEKTEKIISIIVRYTINLAKENNYLVILLRTFMKDGRFSAHIASNDMIELEGIDCKNDYNKLAIYLLKLCNGEDEDLEILIECIVRLKVHKKLLYSVVANILHNCEMNNRDKVWTLVYFQLAQEDFEGQKELLNKMIDKMIEIKGNS